MTITFNTQAATVTGMAGAAPYYDSTQAGYNTIFQKNTEHGIVEAITNPARRITGTIMSHGTVESHGS